MSSRDELLAHLWRESINVWLSPDAVSNCVARAKRRPNEPFADAGVAMERILAAGVHPRDLQLAMRFAAYEAVFGTLYSLDDPGVGEDENVFMLHESLLTADPSGLDGRPGSAEATEK